MYKVVYNSCFGGFNLSAFAVMRAREIAGEGSKWDDVDPSFGNSDFQEIPRHDPVLVQVVEEMGEGASGRFADLKIAEIHSSLYQIDEYDGNESVVTPDNMDWVVIK